jgi:RES domain-containing protein
VEIPDDRVRIEEIDPASLPPGRQDYPAPDSLKAYGADWLRRGEGAVFKVPSALIASEGNFILNPLHPDFRRIKSPLPRPSVTIRACGKKKADRDDQ